MPSKVTDESIERPEHSSSKACTRRSTAQWLLALFIFATLFWVCLWTILAAHTDIASDKIYPALESTYFPDKAGARIFIYFGLFYIVAGAVILAFLAQGINLPKPQYGTVALYKLVGTGEYWSVLEIFALAIFVIVQLITIAIRADLKFNAEWPTSKTWYQVCKTLGKTAALTLTVLFLPICKNNFWLDVFNIQFERSVKFHRWLSFFLVIVVCVHAAAGITSLIMRGEFRYCMWPSDSGCTVSWHKESIEISRAITYGWTAALVALPMVITSLNWFRRHKFELFYYFHLVFGLTSLVLVHLHWPDMIYYTAPGLAAYSLDKVICRCCTRRKVKLVDLSLPAPGFVRLRIAVDPANKFDPGQWVNMNIPAVSLLQWHPMSIASPPDKKTITIDAKVVGDWTRRLEKLALRFDPMVAAHTCIRLDKYHGSSHTKMQGYLNHPAVLMVAGGIGITPLLSAMRSIDKLEHVKLLELVWVVKKESVLDLYREELAQIQASRRTPSGCRVNTFVYATLSEKEDPSKSVSIQIKNTSGHNHRHQENNRCKQVPFMQHVMGYSHKLFLTVGAGCGYLLGIFLANFWAYGKGWRSEYTVLLQLCLALVFSGTIAIVGMSGSLFRPSPTHMRGHNRETATRHTDIKSTPLFRPSPTHMRGHNRETATRHTDIKSTPTLGNSKVSSPKPNEVRALGNTSSKNSRLKPNELRVKLGCRPNIDEIVDNMRDTCLKNGLTSVGVAVCGPIGLTDAAVKASKKASRNGIPFVVDCENFDW